MDRHVFEITFDTASAHTGRVLMDGVELRGVTKVELKAEVGDRSHDDELVSVQITFLPEKVLARFATEDVVAKVKALIAETTNMGAKNRTYVPVPVDTETSKAG